MSEGAVTMLALAILLYLYFKWRVTRCCNSREAELTQVITKPSAPTLDLEMALRMNQSLQCISDAAHAGCNCNRQESNRDSCRL